MLLTSDTHLRRKYSSCKGLSLIATDQSIWILILLLVFGCWTQHKTTNIFNVRKISTNSVMEKLDECVIIDQIKTQFDACFNITIIKDASYGAFN